MTPLPPGLKPVTRIGDWMQTYTGRQFWPIDPRPDEIHIEDIAHALSMACRYSGHCLRFYSVAEHSVHIARHVSPANALWGLLHDASEAYLTDVIRPIKPSLSNYHALEERLMLAVAFRFRIDPAMPREVKDADNRILVDEKEQNMAPGLTWYAIGDQPLGVTIECWSPERAEREFLRAFDVLTNSATTPEDLAVWRAGRGETP